MNSRSGTPPVCPGAAVLRHNGRGKVSVSVGYKLIHSPGRRIEDDAVLIVVDIVDFHDD